MSSASAARTAATLPAPPNGAHSNSAPQAHRLGMTPNLTGTLRPQRAQAIFPIIDLRFTNPSVSLDDRAVARVRQALHSEPLAVVDAFYLEFDDERSGGFEPLAHVAPGKKVVLGLVTTKHPELENRDAVIARIHEAARYVPLEDLCLSPQCGFASCEIGNKLTEDEQWAKIALVRSIAEEVWGA